MLAVLVVDDFRDGADLTSEIVRLLGHDAHVAYSGQSALELAHTFRFDIVLLDLELPDLTGFEVLHRLRSEPLRSSAYMVATTGYADVRTQQRVRDEGFHEYAPKPVAIADIRMLLDRATLSRHAR